MNVKEAVEKAKAEIVSLLGGDEISNIRLEEVNSVVNNNDTEFGSHYWYITFSYLPKETDPLISINNQRIYKVITVDDEGKFYSMKIRELAQV
jgi:hypothetical protein